MEHCHTKAVGLSVTMLIGCDKSHVSLQVVFLQQLICYHVDLFSKSYRLLKIWVWYIEICHCHVTITDSSHWFRLHGVVTIYHCCQCDIFNHLGFHSSVGHREIYLKNGYTVRWGYTIMLIITLFHHNESSFL